MPLCSCKNTAKNKPHSFIMQELIQQGEFHIAAFRADVCKEQSRRWGGAIVFPAVLPVKQKSAQAPVLGTPEQIFSLYVIHCI